MIFPGQTHATFSSWLPERSRRITAQVGHRDQEGQPVDATVHLLVLVKSSSAALEAFISALDRALAASLTSLPSPKFTERGSILDVNLLTEKDVESGRGYAVLLSSVFTPPLKIWQR
jgi:hypothetical protein